MSREAPSVPGFATDRRPAYADGGCGDLRIWAQLSEWDQMMAMSLLMTVRIVLLFFFTQKTLIQGVKLSGIKG